MQRRSLKAREERVADFYSVFGEHVLRHTHRYALANQYYDDRDIQGTW
jgi:hypothetical protein